MRGLVSTNNPQLRLTNLGLNWSLDSMSSYYWCLTLYFWNNFPIKSFVISIINSIRTAESFLASSFLKFGELILISLYRSCPVEDQHLAYNIFCTWRRPMKKVRLPSHNFSILSWEKHNIYFSWTVLSKRGLKDTLSII